MAVGGVVGAGLQWASRPEVERDEWERARTEHLAEAREGQGTARAEMSRAAEAAVGADVDGLMVALRDAPTAENLAAARAGLGVRAQVPARHDMMVAVEKYLAFEQLGKDLEGLVRPPDLDRLSPPPSKSGTALVIGGGLLLFLASAGLVLRPYLVQVIPGMTWIPDLTKLPPGMVNGVTMAVAGAGAGIGTAALISGKRRVDTRHRWEQKIQAVRSAVDEAVTKRTDELAELYPLARLALTGDELTTIGQEFEAARRDPEVEAMRQKVNEAIAEARRGQASAPPAAPREGGAPTG